MFMLQLAAGFLIAYVVAKAVGQDTPETNKEAEAYLRKREPPPSAPSPFSQAVGVLAVAGVIALLSVIL